MNIEDIIRSVGVEGARWLEENVDEQYKALQYLSDHERFLELVTAAAFISFQLSGSAEDWWWEFARWFKGRSVRDIYEAFRIFLPLSKNNSRLLDVKLKRLKLFVEFLNKRPLETYRSDFLALYNDIMSFFGYRKPMKTVSFSVKMYGYAWRIWNGFAPYPMEIPIPLDRRIEHISRLLGMRDPIREWYLASRRTGVPPLHLDTILWVPFYKPAKNQVIAKFPEMKPIYELLEEEPPPKRAANLLES